MYTGFYGFREKPFSLSPDPRYLFLSDSHREVLGHLIYGIEQGEGFIAITGEVGTGKTTLCRTLLERLGPESEVAFLFNPQLSPLELVRSVNAELGLPSAADSLPTLTEALNRFLLRKKSENRRVLLIVDEAQTLSTETLEQIRLLSNLETSTSKLLQIVLLGQPELEEKLAQRELRQLRQRITVWWHLGPLAGAETREYVRHRLRIAGAGDAQLFSEAALGAIHRISGGVPRVINVLCDRALLAGYGENVRGIDRRIVAEVAHEIGPCARRSTRRFGGRRLRWASGAVLLVLGLGLGLGALWHGAGGSTRSEDTASLAAGGPIPAAPASTHLRAPGSAVPAAELPAVDAAGALPTAAPSFGAEVATGGLDREAPGPLDRSAPQALETLLPARAHGEVTAGALDAALVAWGLEPERAGSLSLARALERLKRRGLRALWLEGADLDALRRIDLPTLVQLRAPGRRWVLLRRVTGDRVELLGLMLGETVRTSLGEFEEHFSGRGYVVWREFEDLPLVLRPGHEGAPVAWLQRALARLGFYNGEVHGAFDSFTIAAVRAFQSSAAMPADGAVGPLTKIRLYNALPGYATPPLVEGELGIALSP